MFTCDEMRHMEEPTQLALKLLETEKKHLLEEKQEYSWCRRDCHDAGGALLRRG
jgi:hypothetical protein